MLSYDVLKTLHIVGVVLLVGNVTITAFWKVMADWNGDPRVVAQAQHSVNVADWIFTGAGIVLTLGAGIGAAYMRELPLLETGWLVAGELLFALSGLVWLVVLIPLQIRQGRMARSFRDGGPIPAAYWRDARAWLIWGVLDTLPLLVAVWVMVAKP